MYVINYDNDLIRGSDTRKMLKKLIGQEGYFAIGNIAIDSQDSTQVCIDADFGAFVGGLFTSQEAQLKLTMPIGSYLVIETTFVGDKYNCDFKVVTNIDNSMTNAVKKHFPIFERTAASTKMLNNFQGLLSENLNLLAEIKKILSGETKAGNAAKLNGVEDIYCTNSVYNATTNKSNKTFFIID